MKNITLLKVGFLLATTSISQAQIIDSTIDDPGDIAFVAYYEDVDGFSFVFLDDCTTGTQIRFTDEEWTGSAFASTTTEGEVLWENTTISTIASGTVVHIENARDNLPGISASIGTAAEVDGGFSFNLTADEIIAITGTRSSPGVFLTLIGDTDSVGNTLSGTGLVNGSTAIHHATVTEGYYSGPTNCTGLTIQECAQQINNISNWTFESFDYTDDVIGNINTDSTISTKLIQKTNLSYSPNPVTNDLYLQTEITIQQVKIYNTLGQKVQEQNPNSKNTILELTKLKKGTYYLKVIFEKGVETISIQKK
jgi:hypothetical protein